MLDELTSGVANQLDEQPALKKAGSPWIPECPGARLQAKGVFRELLAAVVSALPVSPEAGAPVEVQAGH